MSLSTHRGSLAATKNGRSTRSSRLLATLAATALAGTTLTSMMVAPGSAATRSVGSQADGSPAAYTFATSPTASTTLKYCPETDPNCISVADEGFWYSARAVKGPAGPVANPNGTRPFVNNYRAELEKAFDTDGNPIGFARLRYRVYGLLAKKTDGTPIQYRINHPYGSKLFTTNKSDPLNPKNSNYGSINVTDDTGVCADPCNWAGVGTAFAKLGGGTTDVLLTQRNAVPGYLGDINVAGTVSGGRGGQNSVVVTRVDTGQLVATANQFNVQGLLG
jgi:hypothetical protein